MEDIQDIDFDKLNILERDSYLKALEQVASSQITLDDFKRHISAMRQAVERALVDEPDYIYSSPLPFLKRQNPKVAELKARLKNYLIFEGFFDRPDQAKAQLDMFKKRLKMNEVTTN